MAFANCNGIAEVSLLASEHIKMHPTIDAASKGKSVEEVNKTKSALFRRVSSTSIRDETAKQLVFKAESSSFSLDRAQ